MNALITRLRYLYVIIGIFVFSSLAQVTADGDSSGIPGALKVYLDCWFCDFDFIRTELPFLTFVHDRSNADIHVMVSRQQTGSGGRAYTLMYYGIEKFAGQNDTITFMANPDITDDLLRRRMARFLKLGMIPYLTRTNLAEQITIGYSGNSEGLEPMEDRWKQWVFRIIFNGSFDGEQQSENYSLRSRLEVDRITQTWKIRFNSRFSMENKRYTYEDEINSSRRYDRRISGLIVRSVSNHWSMGVDSDIYSSTYSNIKLAAYVAPSIEYNIFPYSQSVSKELRLLYSIGLESRQYYLETIYNKFEDSFWQESLEISLQIRKPWGSIENHIRGSHFLNDIEKNRLSFYLETSINFFRGFSFYFEGGFSRIHDQISLPIEDATLDEILLSRRELETSYNYWGGIGLEYSFGSIYNNVVNPRFGQ